MADSKKYDGSQWEHSLRKLTTATADIEPTIYTDGTAITNYTLKGNTTQSGTPTPSNPVDVQGVGNKTANLLDYSFVTSTRYVTVTPITNGINLTGTYFAEINITLEVGTTYYMSWNEEVISGTTYVAWRFQYTDDTYSALTRSGVALTPTKEIAKVLFYVNSTNTQASVDITNLMLNTGTAPLPYEPYGFKIPILNNQGTTNIYLNEPLFKIGEYSDNVVSSGTATYNIAKYEFKGNENITKVNSSATSYLYYVVLTDTVIGGAMCSHLQYLSSGVADNIGFSQNQTYHNTFYFNLGADIMNAQTSGNTAEGFKEWLTAQYAAGTPLTLYRCTATPTTETVTAPSIPTTDGANTITVDTTVQPSEFSATWTGWHDSTVKEWDGTDWQ